MSCAFYSEAQIWPWMRTLWLYGATVMIPINWTDREDYVSHVRRPDCSVEGWAPHLISECGAFKDGAQCSPEA